MDGLPSRKSSYGQIVLMSTEDKTLHDFISALIHTGEAGGVASIVGGVLYMLIRMIKRNGCTCRLNTCKGEELMVMDCEEGAPAPRHRAPAEMGVGEGVTVESEGVEVKVEGNKISSFKLKPNT